MTALYIILGIVLFFVVLFSIHLHVTVDYGDKTVVSVKWLFLKIPVIDTSKPKKDKKPKPKKQKKEKTKKETSNEELPQGELIQEETPQEVNSGTEGKEKPKGNSLIKQLYIEQGYDGLVKMIKGLGKSLGSFFSKIYKTFTIDELYITMKTVGSDAADTAIKHGKMCSIIYPILGKLVSTCKVKKYDFDISPDFLAQKSEAEAFVDFYVTPIKITNAAIVLAVQLVFKELFKILFAKKKSDQSKKQAQLQEENTEKSSQEASAQ
ncbi:MAG: DUF2953 domain-containing protein [Oscillospiraceae bacterium]|nr:DUF2953 domain-containing protein [Oscillospiraceae bacterium]